MTDDDVLERTLIEQQGTVKDYKEEWGWYRYMVGGKMFAARCCPSGTHAIQYANRRLLTLKCQPEETEFLCANYEGILPGFYMNKRNWISICLDLNVPDELICRLCIQSYSLVFAGLTKKQQREIAGE